jgi:hypothetical protein
MQLSKAAELIAGPYSRINAATMIASKKYSSSRN